jgi:cytosine/adenosine deaminase-related metal-dependent hydrolase
LEAGLRENDDFLHAPTRSLIRGMVGGHAGFTLPDSALSELAAIARRHATGVHIHVAEDVHDQQDSLERSGRRVTFRLEEAGVLRSGSIAAHGVHLDRSEAQALDQTESWIVHNCRSNMNNSVGRAPLSLFGPRVALGTDGIDQDMFAESRTAFFRGREDNLGTGADDIARMLANGGELVSQLFDRRVGILEAGALADLVVLDYDPHTPLTRDNIAWHWMFGLSSQHVESVMVGGRWSMYRREMRLIDEEKTRAEARGAAQQLWDRMESL